MSNAIALQEKQMQGNDDLWNNPVTLKDIQEVYQKKATNSEFKVFMEMGKATGLNPFLGEIWLVKYDPGSPAQIFIGRDGYRKSTLRNPAYRGHHVEAIYSNDELRYDYNQGMVYHQPNFKERGKLMGAYCICHIAGIEKPYYVYVDLSEYSTGKSTWSKIPTTMIKKVAEAQCLRMASPEIYSGSYSEAEYDNFRDEQEKPTAQSRISHLIQGKAENITPTPENIEKMIEDAQVLNDLKTPFDLIKKMQKCDQKSHLQGKYKEKLEFLKVPEKSHVDAQTGEITITSQQDIQEESIDLVELSEFDKIKNQLLKARSKDLLDIAADLIRECTEEQQVELKEIYASRSEELKG